MELWCVLNASSNPDNLPSARTLRKMLFNEQANSQKSSDSAWEIHKKHDRRNALY